MIACDSPTCKYEWFHFPCVGLTKKPEANYGTEWYCIECLELTKTKKTDVGIMKKVSLIK